MAPRSVLFAVLLIAVSSSSGAAVAQEDLDRFLAAQGCAVGPMTGILADEAGLDRDALDAIVARATADPATVRTGDWAILPPSLCVIRPPEVKSRIDVEDPEVTASTSAIDAHAEFGALGCFLDGPAMLERIRASRGWSADQAHLEYMRFLAENLRSGDLAFYGNDPLSTPIGFQLLTDRCANVPQIDDIREAQALRDENFDAVIRADAADVICGRDQSPGPRFMSIVQQQTDGRNTNAWLASEFTFMTMGAGWYTGQSATEPGTPRPPLCRME